MLHYVINYYVFCIALKTKQSTTIDFLPEIHVLMQLK